MGVGKRGGGVEVGPALVVSSGAERGLHSFRLRHHWQKLIPTKLGASWLIRPLGTSQGAELLLTAARMFLGLS